MNLRLTNSLPGFGVTVSVTFHLTCIQTFFNSVWIAEWPYFGNELLSRLTICSLCILTICNSSNFPRLVLRAGFGF